MTKGVYLVLVTGSREFFDRTRLFQDLFEAAKRAAKSNRRLLVVHGDARGADTLAEEVCREQGWHSARVAARWRAFGKAAGPIRNEVMADLTEYDEVLAYPIEGKSIGTYDMIEKARTKA